MYRAYGRSKVDLIRQKLSKSFSPSLIEVVDDSKKHHQKKNSHFSVYIVSENFEEVPLGQRLMLIVGQLKADPELCQLSGVALIARTTAEHDRSSLCLSSQTMKRPQMKNFV